MQSRLARGRFSTPTGGYRRPPITRCDALIPVPGLGMTTRWQAGSKPEAEQKIHLILPHHGVLAGALVRVTHFRLQMKAARPEIDTGAGDGIHVPLRCAPGEHLGRVAGGAELNAAENAGRLVCVQRSTAYGRTSVHKRPPRVVLAQKTIPGKKGQLDPEA